MSADHDVLVTELRALADAVLDRLEQTVQRFAEPESSPRPPEPDAASRPVPPDAATGHAPDASASAASACSWCPLCAVAAAVRGEPHELLTRLATQIAALIALLRDLLARYLPPRGPAPDAPGPQDPPPAGRNGTFVPISVTIRR
ncbi:hypothetical protein G352_00252 [Rhodococcus ruber BKS 20-38]|uniref:Uncharacterized protein n=1 Tax=Rhodococcus ruber BKS 20-38 TaxID=1278076 RepID=M2Y2V1_9NOCA|nr:hypothetical protein [Rhodococcus ruber]EME67411.1 hypothetical protein G352_00252 [Rhodococcus ruber BKS 20-38]